MRNRSLSCTILLTLAWTHPGSLSAQCDPEKTFSFNGSGSRFGAALALQDDDLIVGAPGVDVVWFFRAFAGTSIWVPTAPQEIGVPGSGFGSALAVSGARAAIGVPFITSNGIQGAGEVEIWRLDPISGTWSRAAVITGPVPSASANFGYSVDIDGDLLIVGEPGHGNRRGQAHIFTLDNGDQASLTATLTPTASIQGTAEFGYDVAISQQNAVVGVPFADQEGFIDNGTAMLYRPEASGWTFKSKFSFTDFNSNVGAAVDVWNDRIVIGLPYLNAPPPAGKGGGALLVEWNGSGYMLVKTQIWPKGAYRYGAAVAVDGQRAIIGMPGFDEDLTAPPTDHGGFQVMLKQGNGFVSSGPAFTRPSVQLGAAVALSGTRAVVGTPRDNEIAPDSGGYYTYDATLTAFHADDTAAVTSIANATFGAPQIDCDGSLCNDEPVVFEAFDALALSQGFLVVGFVEANTPALGGLIGPLPQLILPVVTNPSGRFTLTFHWANQLPPGFPIWVQLFMTDAATPLGFSASETLLLRNPF